MPASAPPPPRPAEEAASLVVRFGSALGLAAAGSLVCAAPAALRLSSAMATGGVSARAWLALAAAALGPMIAAIVVLRGAGEGVRAFAGPGAGLRAVGIGLWLASLLLALTWFGSLLRATTHHHALAGVTYAFGALGLAVGLGLVAARVVAILRELRPEVRTAAIGALAGAVAIAFVYMAARVSRAASQDPASSVAAATIIDVLAFAFSALLASRRVLGAPRILALLGPPLAVVVLAVGVSALRDGGLRQAIADRAPAFAPAVRLASGR